MSVTTIEQRVVMTIAEHLDWPEDEVTTEKHLGDDLGADSLDQIEILMAIEDEFEISLSDEEAEQVRTVAEAIALVKKYATETA